MRYSRVCTLILTTAAWGLSGAVYAQTTSLPATAPATSATAPLSTPDKVISAREAPKTMPDKYQILLQRSLFSRERIRTASVSRPSNITPTPPRHNPSSVFTGVVKDENEYTAFLENSRTGKATLVRVGQVLPEGTVVQITLDALFLRLADQSEPRRIDLGRTLSGETATSATSATTPPTSTDTATTSTAEATTTPAAGEAAMSSIERLKLRRKKEMEGK